MSEHLTPVDQLRLRQDVRAKVVNDAAHKRDLLRAVEALRKACTAVVERRDADGGRFECLQAMSFAESILRPWEGANG